MNKLNKLKEFKNKLNANIETIDNLIDEYNVKIKEEHKQNIDMIIKNICDGEKLNYEEIKTKYLLKNAKEELNTDVLDKIIINSIDYYYQKKENGIVYDSNLKIVGSYVNNKIIFIN
jgi:hypothetical protein